MGAVIDYVDEAVSPAIIDDRSTERRFDPPGIHHREAAATGGKSIAEWTSVMDLPRRWIMKDVYEIACARVEVGGLWSSISLLITYARKYHISRWLKRPLTNSITLHPVNDTGRTIIDLGAISLFETRQLLRLYEARTYYWCLRENERNPQMAELAVMGILGQELRHPDDEYARTFSQKAVCFFLPTKKPY